MRQAAHVAHHSRGRLHIRVPSAKGKPAALEAIRLALQNLSGVKAVEVNETIGSVTIHYDPRHHPDLERHLASEDSQQDVINVVSPPKLGDLCEIEGVINEAEFLAQHSHVAKSLFDSIESLDLAVKRATNNAIDFKVIAPLGLAVGAFLGLGIHPGMADARAVFVQPPDRSAQPSPPKHSAKSRTKSTGRALVRKLRL
jgi:hypothetical protein